MCTVYLNKSIIFSDLLSQPIKGRVNLLNGLRSGNKQKIIREKVNEEQ